MREELIYIHHMATPRDVLLVSNELESLGLQVKEIEVGTAAFLNRGDVSAQELEEALKRLGFQLIQKKDKLFIEQVKSLLNDYLSNLCNRLDLPVLSVYLEKQMEMVYTTISKRFRKIEERTLENYFINLKADKVKVLLQSSDLSLEEIAFRLNYRSPRSLARMFKETTGFSIKDFKKGDRPAYLLAL